MLVETGDAMDFGALATCFTPMSDEVAANLALRHYGLSGDIRRFATEKDDTFRITTADGAAYVLKIGNADEDRTELDMQVALIGHLADSADLPVPCVFPDLSGALISEMIDPDGQTRLARLITYLPGTVLDTTDSSAAERERIGEVLARLRLAMADFSHPGAHRVVAWDVRHLAGLTDLMEYVADPLQRAALQAGLDRFLPLMPRVEALRRQVLHNDFSRSNLIVDHARPDFVTGIIDFGDAVHTAVAVDVSTALLNQLPRDAAARGRDGDLFSEGRDLLRGYLTFADLTEEELRLIPHMVMGRVIARALLSIWRAALLPENATYILRNTDQGWAQLDWFLARSPEQVSDLFF